MDAHETLVQSGPTTRSWLRSLRDRLPQFEYSEVKYWASFRDRSSNKAYAYLNPSKGAIRLFLALDPTAQRELQPTPSTSRWAARFPSIFSITRETDLPRATQLVLDSQAEMASSTDELSGRRPDYIAAEELPSRNTYMEGTAHPVLVNAYERNRAARDECLRRLGRSCVVCGFNFEARYGTAAAGYIQVHHVVPLATIAKEYRLDPIADLRPVCPNCHAMIHRREPPFSIEDVKQMLERTGHAGAIYGPGAQSGALRRQLDDIVESVK